MTADTMTSAKCTVAGFFDTRQGAEKAREDLIKSGFPHDQVKLVQGQGSTAPPTQPTGFWESLKEMFLPDEDRYSYAEGLRRGGCFVSVRTSSAERDHAAEILERDGAVNMDEREAKWRVEGWPGYRREGIPSTGTVSAPGQRSRATGTAGPQTANSKNEEAIPITEEQVRVGKRVVAGGRVRVRSYTIEEPISEDVKLRNENVAVERRAVDRPVAAGETPFEERVIEAEQHREEPVVSKEARVKEEVKLRKDTEEHTEKVSDKVRRTKVDVQDERGKRRT